MDYTLFLSNQNINHKSMALMALQFELINRSIVKF